VEDVGFANKEEFTINISDLIDAKKLDEWTNLLSYIYIYI
jgi:hypothetical protein